MQAHPGSIVDGSFRGDSSVSVLLEILVIALTLLSFVLFDLYARACERI
jgi:hypothetical protein